MDDRLEFDETLLVIGAIVLLKQNTYSIGGVEVPRKTKLNHHELKLCWGLYF